MIYFCVLVFFLVVFIALCYDFVCLYVAIVDLQCGIEKVFLLAKNIVISQSNSTKYLCEFFFVLMHCDRYMVSCIENKYKASSLYIPSDNLQYYNFCVFLYIIIHTVRCGGRYEKLNRIFLIVNSCEIDVLQGNESKEKRRSDEHL